MTGTLSPRILEVTQEQVLQFLDDFREAYENGDEAFFSYFAHDASCFTISAPTRIDSREEFKRSFGPAFAGNVTRRSQFMAPEVRIAGDTALVTCHNRISVDDEVTNLRATYLIVLHGDELKIAHMHNSPLPLPAAPKSGPRDVEEITVLEERVATAAAQVGTPK
ncbi:nuclear transport factor 2 family protein [Amycolatopsis nigrescens]|uniref:nuclear transport factor 2 family protein n=1 Tax=Amycolatopsis nigrescens TaxID=381445 RepID=UPI000368251B|nr:nuclear transport factor 2 family protein [Amycolatopsis nigrescens]